MISNLIIMIKHLHAPESEWTQIPLKCFKLSFWVYNLVPFLRQLLSCTCFHFESIAYMTIDIAVHFFGMMEFSEHECDCQLSHPDHLWKKNMTNWLYMIWIYTLCKRSILICVISGINQVVHPICSHHTYITFGQFRCTDSGGYCRTNYPTFPNHESIFGNENSFRLCIVCKYVCNFVCKECLLLNLHLVDQCQLLSHVWSGFDQNKKSSVFQES